MALRANSVHKDTTRNKIAQLATQDTSNINKTLAFANATPFNLATTERMPLREMSSLVVHVVATDSTPPSRTVNTATMRSTTEKPVRDIVRAMFRSTATLPTQFPFLATFMMDVSATVEMNTRLIPSAGFVLRIMIKAAVVIAILVKRPNSATTTFPFAIDNATLYWIALETLNQNRQEEQLL